MFRFQYAFVNLLICYFSELAVSPKRSLCSCCRGEMKEGKKREKRSRIQSSCASLLRLVIAASLHVPESMAESICVCFHGRRTLYSVWPNFPPSKQGSVQDHPTYCLTCFNTSFLFCVRTGARPSINKAFGRAG